MKRIILMIVLFVMMSEIRNTRCQIINYDDMVIIINKNSAVSDSVGMYFAFQRKIPEKHICRVSTVTNEEINDSTFRALKDQIKNFLLALPQEDSINYLVTTKGIPLKVARPDSEYDFEKNASVESEIALLNGPYQQFIGRAWQVISPYEYKREKFSRKKFGFYLVTRLDGYNFSVDIKRMIDRSAPEAVPPSCRAKVVFDQDPLHNGPEGERLNRELTSAHELIKKRGYNSFLDTTEIYVTGQTDVLGYVSWGSNDHNDQNNGNTAYTFANGAIATTYVSTSARTFTKPVMYGQSLIADLIAEGVTGVMGHVYEPYSTAHAKASILFERWTSKEFNLAESFYMSSRYLSWMEVIIGDPKCYFKEPKDVVIVTQTHIVTPQIFILKQNYPNPFNGTTTIDFTLAKAERVRLDIYNNLGQRVYSVIINAKPGENFFVFNAGNLVSGIYYYVINSSLGKQKKKMIYLK